jgi:hypothetical protein
MLTVSDFINLIQYYYKHSSYAVAIEDIERFQIRELRGTIIRAILVHIRVPCSLHILFADVERCSDAPPPQMLSIHPLKSIYEGCQLLVEARAHRLPLVDVDSETGQEMIVSVLTQYRILKFIAVNVSEIPNNRLT